MRKLLYISFAAFTLLSSNVAYASSEKLTEDELYVVTEAVCNTENPANESQITSAVEDYLDIEVDSDKLVTMQELAVQMLVLPDTAIETICGF